MRRLSSPHMIFVSLIGAAILTLSGTEGRAQETPVPPDSATSITFGNNQLSLSYEGRPILRARFEQPVTQYRWNSATEDRDGIIDQVVVFTTTSWDSQLVLRGEITGSEESFPCEADRRPGGLDVVRHSFGMSHSLLNRAVYDRNRDWVVSFDYFARAIITPDTSKVSGRRSFRFEAKGHEIIIRFRPRYYQKHRGLTFFQPWTYSVWRAPVTGWCSWFAYYQDITEQNVKHAADVLSESLLPFGFTYLQIDDGYQRGQGLPELWLKPNEKFPGGLNNLSRYIRSRGLEPGIWTNVAFNQHDFAESHREWFVRDADGTPSTGNWVDLSIDGSNRMAIDSLVRPIYNGLRNMGWTYFKVDALRHLRYEGYNAHMEYFRRKNIDRVDAYRRLVQSIRDEIGRDSYMLGCWGIRPELIGIIDGCRIGTDGFSYAGLAQYNSFNNVVWRNDPDHIELSKKEAYRSTTVTSLTGSVMMLTDKPEVYKTEIIESAKRAAPVLFTMPGQIYDVDPSRSDALDVRVNSEVSGSGPRPFDAGSVARCELYALEIDKPYENWLLLGRLGENHNVLAFSDLGLAPDKEYSVFEFWSKTFLGDFVKEFRLPAIDSAFNCQLFCIRERQPHPQLIATSRHVSSGGLEVDSLRWTGTVLRGVSRCVRNDPYDIYVTEPSGFHFVSAECEGADSRVTATTQQGQLRTIHIDSGKGGNVQWRIVFGNR